MDLAVLQDHEDQVDHRGQVDLFPQHTLHFPFFPQGHVVQFQVLPWLLFLQEVQVSHLVPDFLLDQLDQDPQEPPCYL